MKNFRSSAIAAIVTLSLTAGCSNTEPTEAPEQPQQQNKTFNLALEKYQLANGLEVVLHQDKSDPIVAAAIVYHVGSNREKLGKTGFAHFFEHMLFQDSDNVGAGQFIKNIGSMGGILNGGTWYDGTIYYEVVPKDGLEQVLWMESDRMGYFINTVTQKGLENEKQVVKNEKRQRVDNRPYGHTQAVISETLYPKGHPYSWSVIGSLEDLQNATLGDVREFYEKWYGVNNATLVLAGDFDTKQTKAWIEKYFGEFKPRGNVDPLPPMPVSLSENKSLYHEDNFAKVPELTLTFPTIEQYTDDSYALQLLADILSDGKDSVLYQQIVEKDKLAASVSASSNNFEIAGTFTVRIRAFDNVSLDKVKQSIDTALNQFAQNGFTEKQLKRVLARRQMDFYGNLNSVFNKAAAIGTHNEFSGDPNMVVKEIELFKSQTKQDIMNVFSKYVHNKNFVATSFVPKGQVELALKGATKANVVEEVIVQGAEKQMAESQSGDTLPPVAQTPSSIDRSIKPKADGKLEINLPDIHQQQLSNDINVLTIEHHELPLVTFSVRFMGGHTLDKSDKAGVANLLSLMLMEGTKNKTPQQLQAAIGELGAEISIDASGEYITLTGTTLKENLAATLALAQEVLLEPRWDTEQWQRVKQQVDGRILQNQANPQNIATNVFAKLIYGDNSMLSTPITGTQDSLKNIELSDLKAFYKQNLVANVASVHFAGAVNPQELKQLLKPLSKLNKGAVKLPSQAMASNYDKPQLYFIDVPGAKQSVINIGKAIGSPNSEMFYPGTVVNHQLGGSFSGKLFQILRLQKGYTYGAYSQLVRRNAGSAFLSSANVRANVTLESLQEFRTIFEEHQANFDDKALSDSKQILAKSQARNFETTTNLRNVLENITTYQLPVDYVAKQQQKLTTLSLSQAQDVVKQLIDKDSYIYLVIGDAKTQLANMEKLGIGKPIVLDVNGNKI